MSVLTRWLDGKGPRIHQRRFWALASVNMDQPRVIVCTIDDNGTRRVGMAFEQGDVLVEVRLPNPDEVLRDIDAARAWQAGDDAV